MTAGYGKAQRAQIDEWRKAAAEAEKAGKKDTVAFGFGGLAAEWAPKFEAKANEYRGQDGAIRFLTWILANADEGGDAALATLLKDHIASPELGAAVTLIGRRTGQLGAARVREILGDVIEKSPHGDVKAQALLSRSDALLVPPEAGQAVDDEARDLAVADLRAGLACVEDEVLRGRLAGSLNELEHLQVGMVAPDIEGEDLDGIAFQLSDYRGKVILLDFWGYW